MANPIWRSHSQNSINFEFSCYDWRENYHLGTCEITEKVINSDFEMTDPIYRPYIRFPVKIRRFWSGKLEKYYWSVWGITTKLITNLNSAIENPILRSHSWRFHRIHIILYSFVFERFIKGFSHLSCHKSSLGQFELKFIGIYFSDDIYSF